MQYRIVINLAVCAFSCFVANDLATDIYGERCKRVLLNILTNAVYVFLLMDMMLFPYAMILFPVIVFLGFMALSVNYNVHKKKYIYSICHFFFPKLGDSQSEKQAKHYNRARQERKYRKSGVGSFCCKVMERAGNEITAVTVRVGDPQRRIRNQYTGNHKQQI